MVEADEKTIRQYLLDELAEAEVARFEERLMDESDLFEMLMVIEGELIDERLDGRLSPEERAQFDAYFLSTPERRQRLELARALREYALQMSGGALAWAATTAATQPAAAPDEKAGDIAPPSPVIRPDRWSRPRVYLSLAAAALALIAIGYVAKQIIFPPSDLSKGLQALNQAYREQRPTEARISGFDYAPPPPVTRGPEMEKQDTLERDLAASLLLPAVKNHPNAKTYHAAGLLYLAQRNFDEAIRYLDQALQLAPEDAALNSDLGAAYLERGKAERGSNESGKSLEDFARSLGYLSRAIESNDSLLAARFNRAVLYQYMNLLQPAADDWQKYLEKDPSSEWAEEAKRNLDLIEEQKGRTSLKKDQLFQSFADAYKINDVTGGLQALNQGYTGAGNLVIEKLLDEFLAQPDTQRVQPLLYAGELAYREMGDRYLKDLAEFYYRASPTLYGALLQARSLMRLGHEHFARTDNVGALTLYRQAQRLFDQAADQCESEFAEYRIGYCYLRHPEIMQSLSVFGRLEQECMTSGHLWLLARTMNAIADARFALNDYSSSLAYSQDSLRVSEQSRYVNDCVRALAQLAATYQILGDYTKSLEFIAQGLALVSDQPVDLTQFELVYEVTASTLTLMGLQPAAIAYQNAALQLASQSGVPLLLSRAYAQLGLIYAKMKSYDEALRHTRLAFDVGKQLTDEVAGKEIMAFSALRLGHIYRQMGDYDEAIANYDLNLETCDALRNPGEVYVAHKGKLLCHIAKSDNASAEQELKATLKHFESFRTKISEDTNRITFFDREQDIYDIAIDFESSKMNDRERAYDLSEASHARVLLDLIVLGMRAPKSGGAKGPGDLSSPARLKDIQRNIPPEVQLLQYVVLDDRILIFYVSQNEFEKEEREIPIDQLRDKVITYRNRIARPADVPGGAGLDEAGELYLLLIQPMKRWLDRAKYLCIIPDKVLHYLPFDALIEPASGQYLINDFVLGFAPSATLFVRCTDLARGKREVVREDFLGVADPEFDRTLSPSLKPLPSSRREIEMSAALYHPAHLFTGPDAREVLIKSAMQKAAIVHLATHYVLDKGSPAFSKLLLARESSEDSPGPGADGVLQPFEVYEMRLPRTKLVVLSACQTGIDRFYAGEGAISLARSFIAAGVPLVVASLWPVDSDASANLMSNFHEQRKGNPEPMSTARALQSAQLAMLRSQDQRLHHPYYWAAFTLTGGYASF